MEEIPEISKSKQSSYFTKDIRSFMKTIREHQTFNISWGKASSMKNFEIGDDKNEVKILKISKSKQSNQGYIRNFMNPGRIYQKFYGSWGKASSKRSFEISNKKNMGRIMTMSKSKQLKSKDIRNFMKISQKYQTNYATREKTSSMISLKIGDEELLNFLRNTFDYVVRDMDSNSEVNITDPAMEEKINMLYHKITSLKTVYSELKTVCLTVIWVIMYNYENNKIEHNCVIKIYKSDTESIFIDTDGVGYDSWDNFLCFSMFPKALICVPENGDYKIENKCCILNYFKNKVQKLFKSESSLKFKPHFFQVNDPLQVNYLGQLWPSWIWKYVKVFCQVFGSFVLQLAYTSTSYGKDGLKSKSGKLAGIDVSMLINAFIYACTNTSDFDQFCEPITNFYSTLSGYLTGKEGVTLLKCVEVFFEMVNFLAPVIKYLMFLYYY